MNYSRNKEEYIGTSLALRILHFSYCSDHLPLITFEPIGRGGIHLGIISVPNVRWRWIRFSWRFRWRRRRRGVNDFFPIRLLYSVHSPTITLYHDQRFNVEFSLTRLITLPRLFLYLAHKSSLYHCISAKAKLLSLFWAFHQLSGRKYCSTFHICVNLNE